jgi:hypothetical protein
MQPENTNPPQNPNPGVPQQPGQPVQAPFHRRPVQPLAPRPFSTTPAPNTQPQTFAPQQPSADPFARPAQPSQQPQFAPQPQRFPTQPRAAQSSQPLGTPRPQQGFAPQTPQPERPIEVNRSEFTRPVRPQVVEKPGLPKGVFALILIGLAGLAIGFIDKSQHNMIFNVIVALDLLLAFGLFILRREFVHKAAMGFAMVTVIASAALVLGYMGLANSTVNAETAFIAEAKKLQGQSPTKQLTHEQQQHLDAMQLQLEAQQQAVGKDSTLVYGKYGATVVAYSLIALYLTRPKVKEAFANASS